MFAETSIIKNSSSNKFLTYVNTLYCEVDLLISLQLFKVRVTIKVNGKPQILGTSNPQAPESIDLKFD